MKLLRPISSSAKPAQADSAPQMDELQGNRKVNQVEVQIPYAGGSWLSFRLGGGSKHSFARESRGVGELAAQAGTKPNFLNKSPLASQQARGQILKRPLARSPDMLRTMIPELETGGRGSHPRARVKELEDVPNPMDVCSCPAVSLLLLFAHVCTESPRRPTSSSFLRFLTWSYLQAYFHRGSQTVDPATLKLARSCHPEFIANPTIKFNPNQHNTLYHNQNHNNQPILISII